MHRRHAARGDLAVDAHSARRSGRASRKVPRTTGRVRELPAECIPSTSAARLRKFIARPRRRDTVAGTGGTRDRSPPLSRHRPRVPLRRRVRRGTPAPRDAAPAAGRRRPPGAAASGASPARARPAARRARQGRACRPGAGIGRAARDVSSLAGRRQERLSRRALRRAREHRVEAVRRRRRAHPHAGAPSVGADAPLVRRRGEHRLAVRPARRARPGRLVRRGGGGPLPLARGDG